jgi:hypothetical protein
MRPLDHLLVLAATAARIRVTREQRAAIAKDIAALAPVSAREHGAAKAEAAQGLIHLVNALPLFHDKRQADALAAGVALIIAAIRSEPDAPAAVPKPAPTTGPLPPASAKVSDQREPYYLRD